ncbi:MAG: ROK family protein [Rhodomicrobiaceae bacterium]
MTPWRLVADVGGSNVRFARSPASHALDTRHSYALNDYPSFCGALAAYLDETCGRDGCASAAVGVAGPVDDGRVKLTNAPWTVEASEIGAMLGGAPVRLVNDLEAVALALPHLETGELSAIGDTPRQFPPRSTMIAVNVGTGFGGATAIPAGSGWVTNPGEPGHMSLGARDAGELDLIAFAGSVEDVLSGRGVAPLYGRIAKRTGREAAGGVGGAEIFARAAEDDIAAETVRRFSALLGRIAGDLVLAAAAWGGVYLCGSVASGWAAAGGARYFRAAFEDKGAMTERMRHVYSGIITRDDVALVGLTHLPPLE